MPIKRSLSAVKQKILERLWHEDNSDFPKQWVASKELLELTQQKYFDRRTRELREKLGCDLESEYRKELGDHAWRLKSANLTAPQDREYLTEKQKKLLFVDNDYKCAVCGCQMEAGIRGLQADHKMPVSRGGTNDLANWQPLCVTCNVGKRRACEGCELNCNLCSWAFPDRVGVRSMFMLDAKLVTDLNMCSKNKQISVDDLVSKALVEYLSK